MFSVTGTDSAGIGYVVAVGGDAPIAGSRQVVDLITRNAGGNVRATPTSAGRKLDLADPASVLAALHMLTTVSSVSSVDGDDVPDVFDATDEDGEPPPEGSVF